MSLKAKYWRKQQNLSEGANRNLCPAHRFTKEEVVVTFNYKTTALYAASPQNCMI